MKKVILVIVSVLVIGGILFASISFYNTAKTEAEMKTKYEEAVAAAEDKDFITARQLFSELPMDYQYEDKELKTITVQDWIESIDRCKDSPFVGEWKAKNSQGKWDIDIYLSVFDYRGVTIRYSKSYTSSGGVHIGDFGDLYVYNDGITASYTNSNKSNSGHYKLVLKDSNTLELYFDNELEVVLHK